MEDSAHTATLMCWTAAPFPALTRRRNGSPFLNARQSADRLDPDHAGEILCLSELHLAYPGNAHGLWLADPQ